MAEQQQQTSKSEKEKMLAGELYYSFGPELFQERQRAKELVHEYNKSRQVGGGFAHRQRHVHA